MPRAERARAKRATCAHRTQMVGLHKPHTPYNIPAAFYGDYPLADMRLPAQPRFPGNVVRPSPRHTHAPCHSHERTHALAPARFGTASSSSRLHPNCPPPLATLPHPTSYACPSAPSPTLALSPSPALAHSAAEWPRVLCLPGDRRAVPATLVNATDRRRGARAAPCLPRGHRLRRP